VVLSMGLVATVTSLVLGLLINSAKSAYDSQRAQLTELSSSCISLDRLLAHYGTEASGLRVQLRKAIVQTSDELWSKTDGRTSQLMPDYATNEALFEQLQALSPKDEKQHGLKNHALDLLISMQRTRWLMYTQAGASVPHLFLLALVSWLAILYFSFGLFAPSNATVFTALFASALVVSTAILIILELSGPFSGAIAISKDQMHASIEQLGR